MEPDSIYTIIDTYIYQKLQTFGIPAVILLIVYLIFRHLDDIRVLKATIFRMFCFFGDAPSKLFIASDIKSRLGRVITSKHYKDYFDIYDVKIKWVDKKINREAFIQKYKIVIKLEHAKNQDRNFAIATHLIVKSNLLKDEKLYLDYPIRTALDLVMAKDIIIKEKGTGGVTLFNHEILDPELKKDEKAREYYPILSRLQFAGFLRNIFFLELRILKNRYYPEIIHDIEIQTELNDFINFLDNIATREIGEEIDLAFDGTYIKVLIILMAKRYTVSKGIEPYVKAVQYGISNGFSNFYLLAFQHCILKVGKVAKETRKLGCSILDDFGIYRGTISNIKQNLRCIHVVGGSAEKYQLEFDIPDFENI